MPVQKTLVLINNFIVTTADYLNAFSDTVEKKIAKVSNRITDLETLLAVLEAKLNSVPDLDNITTTLNAIPLRAEEPSIALGPPSTQQQQKVPVSEHPSYAPFFTLLKVGVPPFVVQAKISAAGLDPSMVDTPELLISL